MFWFETFVNIWIRKFQFEIFGKKLFMQIQEDSFQNQFNLFGDGSKMIVIAWTHPTPLFVL